MLSIFGLRFTRRKPVGPLQFETVKLQDAIAADEAHAGELHDRFASGGYVCCAYCAFPELSALEARQERRRQRLAQLRAKIARDTRRAVPD